MGRMTLNYSKIISKLAVLAALIVAPSAAFGQRSLVSMTLTAKTQNQVNQDFYDEAVRQLGARRDVAVLRKGADYDVFVAVTPINQTDAVVGYTAAVLVIPQGDKCDRPFSLYNEIGPTIKDLVKRWIYKLDKEFFQARKR